jgi:hypothetical protein
MPHEPAHGDRANIESAIRCLAKSFSDPQPHWLARTVNRATAMRPDTLYEVAAEELLGGITLGNNLLQEFLDEFYLCTSSDRRKQMLAQEPPLLASQRRNALYGAVAEYLSRQYKLGSGPAWCYAPERFLDEPWHTCDRPTPGLIEFLTFSSPAEFRHRNIFTEARPLRRATTPNR